VYDSHDVLVSGGKDKTPPEERILPRIMAGGVFIHSRFMRDRVSYPRPGPKKRGLTRQAPFFRLERAWVSKKPVEAKVQNNPSAAAA